MVTFFGTKWLVWWLLARLVTVTSLTSYQPFSRDNWRFRINFYVLVRKPHVIWMENFTPQGEAKIKMKIFFSCHKFFLFFWDEMTGRHSRNSDMTQERTTLIYIYSSKIYSNKCNCFSSCLCLMKARFKTEIFLFGT